MAVAAYVAALVASCFHPEYHDPRCGPGGECPDGLPCNAQGICKKDDVTCFESWHNDSLVFSTPQELTVLSSRGDDRKPWISSDGLTLYFASNRDGSSDVFRSSREAPGKQFGEPFKLSNLSVIDREDGGPSLTADEKILAMASNRGSNGLFQIYITTRADTMTDFGSLHQDHLSEVNAANLENFDPFFTADGLRLYLSPDPAGAAHPKVMSATRPDVNSDFSAPMDVPGINVVGKDSASPALSSDERIIVFTSDRDGGAGELDVWYATRPDTAVGFSPPVPIPFVNTAEDEADPMLSADGCELFFSSRRNGGDHDLFVVQIAQ